MKVSAILAGILWVCLASHVFAEPGSISSSELAAMGLSSVHVISDSEASTIRVHGTPPNRWGNLYPFVKGVYRMEQRDIRSPLPVYPLRTTALVQLRYSRRR